jgi:hypothetical protein
LFINPDLTVKDFKAQCMSEDNKLKQVEVVDEKKTAFKEETKLYGLLTEPQKKVSVQFNGCEYKFKTHLED